MNNESLKRLRDEAFEHLWKGRFRLALTAARKVFESRSQDSDAAILYAWALLENGHPVKAMELANFAVELDNSSTKTRFYRAFILNRMSIFEGAISDLELAIDKEKESLAWSYRTKAQALAGLQRFNEAQKAFSLAILIDGGKHKDWELCSQWYADAISIVRAGEKFNSNSAIKKLAQCEAALANKEVWYALFVSQVILKNSSLKQFHNQAELIELEAMFELFQFIPALKKAEKLHEKFKHDKKFLKIYKALIHYQKLDYDEELEKSSGDKKLSKTNIEPKLPKKELESDPEPRKIIHDVIFFPNNNAEIFSAKVFNVNEEKLKGKRNYYSEFDLKNIEDVGLEVIFENKHFNKKDITLSCRAVWYINDFVLEDNNFNLEISKEWDSVIFAQIFGSEKTKIWEAGQARVEIYIENLKVCEKKFGFGNRQIQDEAVSESKTKTEASDKENTGNTLELESEQKNTDNRSLEELLEELDGYIGLENIKKSVREYIDYINFNLERKREGYKTPEKYSINAVFLGNPGTGKTTIARLMGNIFKAMGIISKGHVVETDRATLVGQYIGETAQKTEEIIKSADGGVLFIDEAYTLIKKGGSGQDFGQEAIDVLLKRMEDKKGQFSVIAAGYPEEMQSFIESNPGLQSRFTHTFIFEDYIPDELEKILDLYLEKEEYKLDPAARTEIKKELTRLYRTRDKSFGNARLVRKLFEDLKIGLSKRYLSLPEEKREKSNLNTICVEDVNNAFIPIESKHANIPIDEEKLADSLKEINSLIGLNSVKKEINDLVKLSRYFVEEGISLQSKISSHSLFIGNPGTGKTTVARIYSKLLSSLGLLEKGHLIETDKQGLIAPYIGQTAEKTNQLIDKALGGTLFIDEAYSLTSGGDKESSFGKEAVDTLLKRMEDDRGKFIVIAAGYTNEMKSFINSNPGLESRFSKTLFFEDYNPDELIAIGDRILKKKNCELDAKTRESLQKYYNEEYRKRDRSFGNARIVRNIIEKAVNNLMLRVAEIPADERENENTSTLILDDIKDIISAPQEARQYKIKGDPEKLNSLLDELKNLAGLETVKKEVEKLLNGIKVAEMRRARGLRVIDKSLHSIFSGNPGTGKTTVARLLSKIYKEMGLLEKGHLVEVDRSDLVAGYQGQTAIKTDKIIEKSLGGTLFIDEAYTLSRGGNDFGQEAIDTLLKRMEDYRGNIVVIAAGYTKEMEQFAASNPGLQSRFTNFFFFDDYKPRQLLEIAHNIALQSGYHLDEGALQLMLEKFSELYQNRDENFGNARTARNILYEAVSNQEERISDLLDASDADLMTITFDDVNKIQENTSHF